MRVLVAAAHADDETLGAGGAIARHVRAGDDVRVVIAADCRSARDLSRKPSLSDEAIEALNWLLGHRDETEARFLGFAAMQLASSEQKLNIAVTEQVREFRPDVIYTHHWCDVNTDHAAMNRAVMVAARPSGGAQRVLCFEVPSSTEWAWGSEGFRPNYFINIAEHIEIKLAAMACYHSELREAPHPRNLEALRQRAAYWGQVAGCLYAEPFVLAREVVK